MVVIFGVVKSDGCNVGHEPKRSQRVRRGGLSATGAWLAWNGMHLCAKHSEEVDLLLALSLPAEGRVSDRWHTELDEAGASRLACI